MEKMHGDSSMDMCRSNSVLFCRHIVVMTDVEVGEFTKCNCLSGLINGLTKSYLALDRRPRSSVGRASFLTTRTDCRWWFDSPLVRE